MKSKTKEWCLFLSTIIISLYLVRVADRLLQILRQKRKTLASENNILRARSRKILHTARWEIPNGADFHFPLVETSTGPYCENRVPTQLSIYTVHAWYFIWILPVKSLNQCEKVIPGNIGSSSLFHERRLPLRWYESLTYNNNCKHTIPSQDWTTQATYTHRSYWRQ